MKTVVVRSKWFNESDLRLDASFHVSDGIVARKQIAKSPYKIVPIKSIAEKIFFGGRSKRYYVSNQTKGLPFIGSSDMLKSDISKIKSVSKVLTKDITQSILKKGWTLVSRSGTIGNTAYTNEDFVGKIASEHIIRVVPKTTIQPGFLYAFLSSKYGYSLLTQGTFGAVVQHIEPDFIEGIPIPIFPLQKQKHIHEIIEKTAALRVEANELLKQAISIFEKHLGKNSVEHKFQYGSINVKDIKSKFSRIDSHFQLITKAIKEQQASKFRYVKIATITKQIKVGNRSKRLYSHNGTPFLSSSDMMLFNPIKYAKKISSHTVGLNELKVKRGAILISRSGTVGNVVLVGDNLRNVAISEHAMQLEVAKGDVSPEYVFCYLRTEMGKSIMEASAFGSVIITLNEELISNIDLPILPIKDRAEITRKICDYQIKIDSATSLENKAIGIVENEISKWQ